MKKVIVFTILFSLLFTPLTFAQEVDSQEDVLEEPMIPQNNLVARKIIDDKKPIPYPSVRPDDIMWSETVWRIIDCRDRMNFPLYYPTVSLSYRQSFIQALIAGIQSKKVQAYDTDTDEFKTKLTPEEVLARFDAGDRVIRQQKMDGSGDTTFTEKNSVNWADVRKFIIKEQWFFDRHRSVMDVRIIGICPIRVYNKSIQVVDEEEMPSQEVQKKLFWVYFPEARRVLANTVCFMGKNELADISYDDLFHKRRFASYIIAKSDPMNDRQIADYTRNGIEAIMESNRMKDEIMKMESDFWEY